jgi:hypothetical protein
MRFSKPLRSCCCVLPLLAGAAIVGLSGCEKKKEKIIDIETPNTDIEVERSKTDGSLEIKIQKTKKKPRE